jgi:hypothetical protein
MSERDTNQPVAVVLHRFTVREGADPDAFERCVLEEVFPTVNTAGEGGAPDQHLLLNGGDRNAFVWMSRLEYEIHQTPLPGWLSNRVAAMRQDAAGRLATFGSIASTEVYYDVAGWRRRLGK